MKAIFYHIIINNRLKNWVSLACDQNHSYITLSIFQNLFNGDGVAIYEIIHATVLENLKCILYIDKCTSVSKDSKKPRFFSTF